MAVSKLEKQLLEIVEKSTLSPTAKERLITALKTEGFTPRWYAMFDEEIAKAQDALFASTNLTLDPKEHPELAAAMDAYVDEVKAASAEYAATIDWAEKETQSTTNDVLKNIAKTQVALAAE